ncbi:MAG: hypothetical protein R6V77_08230, partial [Candidatus Cloacimonadaceae bacterium]
MIILSLPYKDKDSFQSRLPLGADLAEFRLDYCSDLAALDFSQLTSRHILSYRDPAEGGKNAEDAMDSYERVLEIVGEVCGDIVAPNA